MTDKSYRVTIQIACDATVIDKTARANMGTVDDIVEKLLADNADSAVAITVTEAANIVAVREKSDKPRAKRGAAVADELAALKARLETALAAGTVQGPAALTEAERTALSGAPSMTGDFAAQSALETNAGKRVKPNAHAHDADA